MVIRYVIKQEIILSGKDELDIEDKFCALNLGKLETEKLSYIKSGLEEHQYEGTKVRQIQNEDGSWGENLGIYRENKPNSTTKDFDIMMNPEKHGYKICPNCNGYGSSLKEAVETCSVCHGKGVVKKDTEKKH